MERIVSKDGICEIKCDISTTRFSDLLPAIERARYLVRNREAEVTAEDVIGILRGERTTGNDLVDAACIALAAADGISISYVAGGYPKADFSRFSDHQSDGWSEMAKLAQGTLSVPVTYHRYESEAI